MTVTSESDIYYDPYDFEIDADPYPVWKRLRDEAPLYYNEKYDFFALSRFDDVEDGLVDWKTYSSGKGSVLELIKADIEMPAGHRSSSRTRRPRPAPRPAVPGVHAQEDAAPSSRRSASSAPARLDPLVGARRLRLHRRPRRPDADAHDRHAARHPRGRTRRRSATRSTTACASRTARCPTPTDRRGSSQPRMFADYIDWRAEHPSDDLMTELLNAEFEDETATTATADPRRGPQLRQPARRRPATRPPPG